MTSVRAGQIDDKGVRPAAMGVRWDVIGTVVVAGVWVMWLAWAMVGVFAPGGRMSFRNGYGITAVTVVVTVLVGVSRYNLGRGRPVSYLAVLAALAVALNPLLSVMGLGGRSWAGANGSFRMGLLALAMGIVAMLRVGAGDGRVWGMRFAMVGIVGGLFIAGGWVVAVMLLVRGW